MIEAMEQQIINSINNKWTKNKEKRKDINIELVSESFRVICSSRSTTLALINDLKKYGDNIEDKIQQLKNNISTIYDWITKESINTLISKYYAPLKNKKKEAEYKEEVPHIETALITLKENVIEKTMDKLFIFYNIKKEQ